MLFRSLHTFKGTARFSTWLYSIVRNESISRGHRAPPPMDDESALLEVASMDAQPDELAERRTQGQRVRDFLAATLDPLERTVYTLHYGDEMPLDVITRLLGLDNPSGAKASIVSARRKLARAAQRLRARGERL